MKKLALILLFALTLAPLCLAQSQLAGDWQGTLDANGQPFRIAWHVTAGAGGDLTSTLDSIDMGVLGIKVKSTTVKDSAVTLEVDDMIQVNGSDVHLVGKFEGAIDKDSTELKGTWTQLDPEQPPANLVLKHTPPQPASAQPTIAGDWKGSVHVNGAELHLVLHIAAAKDGSLTATMDSVDQGANAIPVTSITLDGAKLHMTVDSVKGTYEGAVNKDASEIDGTWSQGQPLELNLTRAPAPVAAKPAPPSDIDGTWQGTLDTGSTKLAILIKIVNTGDGLTAKMQSPDQSPVWLDASSITRDSATVSIGLKAIGGSFEGKLAADLGSIEGTFSQAGNLMPLVVKRVKE